MSDARVERKLAAIMAADVVGYTRLMSDDEAGTLQRLKALRSEVIEPTIAEFGGRIVKLIGDGLIAEFPSVVDAVQAAARIQSTLQEARQGDQAGKPLELRIGVNLGDVIVDGDDIYGDGVNVAARLESIATPGSVFLSGPSYDVVAKIVDFAIEDLGTRSLKNLDSPVRVYQIVLGSDRPVSKQPQRPSAKTRWLAPVLAVLVAAGLGAAGWMVFRTDDGAQSDGIREAGSVPRLAVLPFRNLSPDSSQEYFAQGIAADLIVDLSKLSGIAVISRTSSFALPSGRSELKAAAQKLGVRYIVSGSVRRHVGTLRINAQLVDTSKDSVVWGHRFDGTTKDVFRFQDQIVSRIVIQLRKRLSPDEEATITQRGTTNPDAYDAFVLGTKLNASQRDLDADNNKAAMAAFQKAIQIDPKFARSYAGLAWAHWLNFTLINPEGPGRDRALALAEKSLKLKTNALSYLVLSRRNFSLNVLNVHSRRNPDKAIASLISAERLEPSNADVLATLAETLPFVGRNKEALAKVTEAIKLNPKHPNWYYRPLAIAQFVNGRYELSAQSFGKLVVTSGATSTVYNNWRAAAWALAGKLIIAKRIAQKQQKSTNWLPSTITALRREWPLPEEQMKILVRGLKLAGVPD